MQMQIGTLETLPVVKINEIKVRTSVIRYLQEVHNILPQLLDPDNIRLLFLQLYVAASQPHFSPMTI